MRTILDLPSTPPKPRATRRTHIIDIGAGPSVISDQLSVVAEYVDLAKLGWGTSLVTPNLLEKVETYRRHQVEVCFGGTLFELVYLKDKVDHYRSWLDELGIRSIEVSDGALEMDGSDKLRFISELSEHFTVYSEVGSKDAEAIVTPARWVHQIKDELEAGAAKVILEGRESGTAGMYRPSGEIRMGLIDEVIEAGIAVDRLIFEAPNKSQQVWLLRHLGPDLNLGNIHLEDVVGLETLRLGLRADTLHAFHGRP